jgi:Lrp/AsnC family transcriptional regulator, leucine-responsive regulatory protein
MFSFTAMPSSRHSPDAFDRKILALVQSNNLLSCRQISETLGLSLPAVARRLQRLRKEGVITADTCIVNQDSVGAPLTIIVHLTVDNQAIEEVDAMRERFVRCPQVQQCYYVTGESDFVLIILARDMAEYESLTQVLFFKRGNVKHFSTYVVMRKIKVSLRVPLYEAEQRTRSASRR